MIHPLFHLLIEHSVRWGDFTLSSGKKSDLYVDVRATALHPEGSLEIAKAALWELLPEVEALGGVELGAVPVVGSVITLNQLWIRDGSDAGRSAPWEQGRTLPGFIVRKQAKEHGTKSKIENCPPEGTPVCIIEDVTTTGGSLERAITSAEKAGLKVVQAITVEHIAHGEAVEFLRAGGFQGEFTALATRTNLRV